MNMNNENKIPDSIARIPVAVMRLAELRSLEKKTWRLYRTFEVLEKRLPEVWMERWHLWQLWQRLHDGIKAKGAA